MARRLHSCSWRRPARLSFVTQLATPSLFLDTAGVYGPRLLHANIHNRYIYLPHPLAVPPVGIMSLKDVTAVRYTRKSLRALQSRVLEGTSLSKTHRRALWILYSVSHRVLCGLCFSLRSYKQIAHEASLLSPLLSHGRGSVLRPCSRNGRRPHPSQSAFFSSSTLGLATFCP